MKMTVFYTSVLLQGIAILCIITQIKQTHSKPLSGTVLEDVTDLATKEQGQNLDNCFLKQENQVLGRDLLNRTFSMTRNVCETKPHVTDGICYAKRAKVVQFPLQNGVQKLSDGKQCRFVNNSKNCRRFSKVEIFFPGTAYEQAVNVGMCGGGCKEQGHLCRPVSHLERVLSFNRSTGDNESIPVSHVVPVINKCECAGSCYRVPNVITYSVFVTKGDFVVTEDLNVDFGRCVAAEKCPPVDLCGPWDPTAELPFPFGTITSLTSCIQQQECSPLQTRTSTITLAPSGKQIDITTIESCGCKMDLKL